MIQLCQLRITIDSTEFNWFLVELMLKMVSDIKLGTERAKANMN